MATRTQKEFLTFLPLIICALFALSAYLFYSDAKVLHQKGYFQTKKHGAYVIKVEDVRGFMTFEYINERFNLPEDYLKNSLAITSKEYPKLTIKKAATLLSLPEQDFVSYVQETITLYASAQDKQ